MVRVAKISKDGPDFFSKMISKTATENENIVQSYEVFVEDTQRDQAIYTFEIAYYVRHV